MAEETSPIGLNLGNLVAGLQAPTQAPPVEAAKIEVVETPVVETPEVVETPTEETTAPEVKSDEETKSLTQLLKADYLPEIETEFPETFEGVSSFVKEVADSHIVKGRQAMMEQLVSDMPELEDYLEYRLNGGKPESYFKTLSESATEELDLTSIDSQKKAMRLALGDKMEAGDLDTLLETLEETGKLKESAEKYYSKIKESNSTKASELVAQQAKLADDQKKANEAHWTSLKKVIDTGNLGTAVIPTTERKSFYDWLAVPDKDGKVGQQKTWESMTPEQKLAAQYFIFKKGDVGSLASRTQTSKKVDEVVANLRPGSRLTSDKPSPSVATRIAVGTISGTTFQ